MADVVHIGLCIGCARQAILDDGVCAPCLTPPRGRRWAELSHRARTDLAFAIAVYCAITTESGRKVFAAMYGVPASITRRIGP